MIKDERLATLYEYLVEDAGMAIGYWAETATHDSNKQTYTVTAEVWTDDEDSLRTKVLTYEDLHDAVFRIAENIVVTNQITRGVCKAIIDGYEDDVDYDADDADIIVQVAMFDDVLFG